MSTKVLCKIKSFFLAEREIICVSKSGIKSKKVGFLFFTWNVLLVFWTSFATIEYFDFKSQVAEKSLKIIELETDNRQLLSNILILEKSIEKIENFIITLNRFDRFASIDKAINYNEEEIDTKNIQLVLDRSKNNLQNVNLALVDRIKSLNAVKSKLDFDNNVIPVSYKEELQNINTDINPEVADSIVMKKALDKNLENLENLEEFINLMPFPEPMQSIYISSSYGKRLDPFTKKPKTHYGTDFVGPYMSKIYSPAPGKVIFAGLKGGYGKVIILQHEHKIKTIYAHLNSYKVKVGDVVKRGDLIAIQGNTGRSTGHHLHYEILKGRDRYNPREFMKIGSNFY